MALLLDAKGVCLLDGEEELLVEHLRGAVGRQVEPVEAGVRPVKKNICWKKFIFPNDGKLSHWLVYLGLRYGVLQVKREGRCHYMTC